MHEMTKANLEAAFAGESQAHMKYLIFADQAEKDGFPNVARIFRAAAFAEQVHATSHFKVLKKLSDTSANLQAGIDGETFEVEEMYPAYNAVAELQDDPGASRSTRWAREAEKVHAVMYQDAKTLVDSTRMPKPNSSTSARYAAGRRGRATRQLPHLQRQKSSSSSSDPSTEKLAAVRLPVFSPCSQ